MTYHKFIMVDAEAAEELVTIRTIQSEDFDIGRSLAAGLTGKMHLEQLSSNTFISEAGGGLYFLHKDSNHSDFIIIDLETAPVFNDCSSRDIIIRFQKLLRFARRRWTLVSPSHCEHLIQGSTKAIVFPYPITTQSSIRFTIELAPDSRRREKRSRGIEILVYRIGTNEGGGPHEEAPVKNFRRALEHLPNALEISNSRVISSQNSKLPILIDSLSITKLLEGTVKGSISGLTFDQWQHYLTEMQQKFIIEDLNSPHRIEGPAGTGKTLSLVLKCIYQLRKAKEQGKEHKSLFVAHSEATRKNIESMFEPELLGPSGQTEIFTMQAVKVTTLHELCGELLRYEISDAELLDRDAFESKQSQLLYAIEALQEIMDIDFESHKKLMSESFSRFLEENDQWLTAEMLQHEISVMIKGRADENLEKYKLLPKLKYGLPVETVGDKAFVFLLFNSYQRRLRSSGQFDTDDVVLSAFHQLDTPIWRRRREKEGYDSIFVDETHLFNINELSVFHRLTRSMDNFPIAYSADVSQSIGDRGWSDVDFDQALSPGIEIQNSDSSNTLLSSIFRCSPEIVNLAFSVTSSGATLFTNFQDPLVAASSAFTDDEERKCQFPNYLFYPADDIMISEAFALADRFSSEMNCTRGDIAIIVFGSELFNTAEHYTRSANKPVEVLKHRGDMELVKRARSSGRFILSTPDFVGGLEFFGAILVGVDKGRVPPRITRESIDSENFVSYASHQRLYVSITRARYRISILGVKALGPSELLRNAISHDLISSPNI